MKIHELKTCKKFFDEVANGNKTFEIRYNDRDYQIGDKLVLRAVTDDDARAYIDGVSPIHAKITYVVKDWGLEKGYVVLALKAYLTANSK